MADPVADTRDPVARVNFEVAKAKRISPEPTNLAKGFEAAGLATESVGTGPAAKVQRVMSVDALRGFTIFWILGGDGLAWSLQEMTAGKDSFSSNVGRMIARQFAHVAWEGFRFYDFLFPMFVFITGVAITLSLPRLVEREGKAKAHLRVLRRALLLYVLGVIFYGGVSKMWPDIRLLGVLQRIGICYLFASLLFLNFRLRGMVIAFVALLVGYWALMTFVPVPGIGAGSFAKDANLANWIDLHYLPGRRWDGNWDPEGLLSTLPAIGTCLIGVFAGMLLTNPRIEPQRKSLWLMGVGIVTVLAGYLWGLQFPVIKSIWTSSFVLVTGGYGLLLLGAMHQLIDVWGYKAWATIFVWIGANAITLYILNNVTSFEQFASRLVGGDIAAFFDRVVTPGTGFLVAYAGGLAVAVAIAGFLYHHKVFVRV
jgi:predicted acyltransferase